MFQPWVLLNEVFSVFGEAEFFITVFLLLKYPTFQRLLGIYFIVGSILVKFERFLENF